MSPNSKQNVSKSLEDEIQNANSNPYVHEPPHQLSSDEEDEILNNGYVLLNQHQNLNDSESESSTEQEVINEVTNNQTINESENQLNELENELNEPMSQLRSNLNNQSLHLESAAFEREYDKKELNDVQNPICLNEDNIDQIKECMKNISLPLIPNWALNSDNKVFDQKLTNFIYKRLEQANK